MKVVLQRVSTAQVTVDNAVVGKINAGLLLLVGFRKGDDETLLAPMADKILTLRVFPDAGGEFDRSVVDCNGGVLLVSQFTLYGETAKGRRPDFVAALDPTAAAILYEKFVSLFRARKEIAVASGVFRAPMKVLLENDGPVTLILERNNEGKPAPTTALA